MIISYYKYSGTRVSRARCHKKSWFIACSGCARLFSSYKKIGANRVCMGKNPSYFIWVSPDLWYPPSTYDTVKKLGKLGIGGRALSSCNL